MKLSSIRITVIIILYSAASYSQWFQQASGTNVNLHSVNSHHGNENTAWSCGDNGVILHTTNGGTNWVQQVSGTTNDLYCICFMEIAGGPVMAVGELKDTLPADSLPAETVRKLEESSKLKTKNVIIESDISMLIPDSYIEDENTRLELYRKLSSVTEISMLKEMKEEFTDRFGKQPEETKSLFEHLEIELMLSKLGFEKIVISGDTVELFFDMNNESIFTGGFLEKVLGYVNESFKNTARVKQGKNTLSLKFLIPYPENYAYKLKEINNLVTNLSQL